MYEHLLVPVDGSELSDRAIKHSIGLAKMLGAAITGFMAEPPLPVLVVDQAAVAYDVETFKEHDKRCEQHARTVLQKFADEAKQAGVTFDGQFMITDNIQQSIVDVAAAPEVRFDRHGNTRASWPGCLDSRFPDQECVGAQPTALVDCSLTQTERTHHE
jgi:nucleotide-binding universal stress UspA family protein